MFAILHATVLFTLVVHTLHAQVVINEIMSDPVAGSSTSGGEYVELLNLSDSVVPIAGWKIVDGTGKGQGTVPDEVPLMAPHSYVVIAGDTSIYLPFPLLRDAPNVILLGRSSGLGLNNDDDDLMIVAADGTVIDSLHYEGSWHLPDLGEMRGLSLERISATAPSSDHRNWSTSAARSGGTPSQANSIAVPVSVSSGEVNVVPRVVLPGRDGRADFVRVSWRLPVKSSRIRLAVYDLEGHVCRIVLDNEPSGPVGETVFDGRDDDGMPLGIGVYIARVEWIDGEETVASAQTGVIVGP